MTHFSYLQERPERSRTILESSQDFCSKTSSELGHEFTMRKAGTNDLVISARRGNLILFQLKTHTLEQD